MRRLLIWPLGAVLLVLIGGTVLPELPFDNWWIQYFDFPRLYWTAILAGVLLLWLALRRLRSAASGLFTLAGLAALGVQLATLWPYQPLAQKMVPTVLRCTDEARFRIVIANVLQDNRDSEAVLAMVRDADPDVFIAMETNEWWDDALAPLADEFPHVEQAAQTAPEFFGMTVMSRHPFNRADMTYPAGSDTPMFDGEIAHPAGPLHLLGVHPRPPEAGSGGVPSTLRDATVLTAALAARDSDPISIIAGDFNATPWDDMTRTALRIGQLVDPRVGRGPMVTYSDHNRWTRWPVDQILWQEGPGLLDMAVLPAVGSDHYPVRVDLCLTPEVPARAPSLRDDDLDAARRTIQNATQTEQPEG